MQTKKKKVVNTNDTPLQKEIRKYLQKEGLSKEEADEISDPNLTDIYIDKGLLEYNQLPNTCSMYELGNIDTDMIESYPEIYKEILREELDIDNNPDTIIVNINTTPKTKVDKFFKSLGFKLAHQYEGNEGNVCTYIR